MLQKIGRNLGRLADFKGRENSEHFWLYAGIVIGFCVIVMSAFMYPFMTQTMERMQEFEAAHPDQATVTSGPGHYSIEIRGSHPDLFGDMDTLFAGMGLAFALAIVLLASAVVRRLHDTGRSGLFGLMPLPFIAYSMWKMPLAFRSFGDDMGLFFSVFVSNFLYIASLGLLVFFLAMKSVPGANQYGDEPEN